MPRWACPALELTANGALRPRTVPDRHSHGLRTSPRAEGARIGSRGAVSARRRRRALACPRTGQRAADSLDALARAHGPGERGRAILCNSADTNAR